MEPRTITIDVLACNGCGDCITACVSQLGQRPSAAGDRTTARIRVLGTGPLFWLAVCRHCAEAPCVDACISGALRQSPAGVAVELDDGTCVGCAMCTMACPFGAVWLNTSRSKSAKCDGCPAHTIPPCVVACSPGALRLNPVTHLTRERRRRATVARLTPDKRAEGNVEHLAATPEGRS